LSVNVCLGSVVIALANPSDDLAMLVLQKIRSS
jgi:hypothetical protein